MWSRSIRTGGIVFCVVEDYGNRWNSVLSGSMGTGEIVLCDVREYGDRWDSVICCQGVCGQVG